MGTLRRFAKYFGLVVLAEIFLFCILVFIWLDDIQPFHNCGTIFQTKGYTTITSYCNHGDSSSKCEVPVLIGDVLISTGNETIVTHTGTRIEVNSWWGFTSMNEAFFAMNKQFPLNGTLQVCINNEGNEGIYKWFNFWDVDWYSFQVYIIMNILLGLLIVVLINIEILRCCKNWRCVCRDPRVLPTLARIEIEVKN